MHSSIFSVFFQKGRILSFCSVATGTRPELSALITADLNEELVCGKLERSQWTLKQTSQGDSSYKSEPQQQSRASGSRALHTNTTQCFTCQPDRSLGEHSFVCVLLHDMGRRAAERIETEGGRKGKRMKKRLYWAERAALQGSSCCVLIRAGCENKAL